MSATESASAAERPVSPSRAPRRRWLRWVLAAIVVVLVAGAWLAVRASQVRGNLTAARSALATARTDLLDGGDRTQALLKSAQDHTAAARGAVHDPLWSLASRIPVAGDAFRTTAGVAEVSDRLTQQSLPVLVGAADDLRTVRGAGGVGVPVETVSSLAGPLSQVQQQLADDEYALRHLPGRSFIGAVDDARTELLGDVARLAGPVRTAATAARLAPTMLGESRRHRYLVAFENPSEARPDAGNIGGYAELVVRSGRFHVARFGSNGRLPQLRRVPETVSPTMLAAYGQFGAGRLWTNTNLSPNFPDDAAAWAAMYATGTGRRVDGVIALDPVALGALAQVTGGGIAVPGVREVQPQDLPAFIESGEYALGLPRDQRQSLLASVGRATLDRVLAADVSTQTLLTTFGRLAGEGHLRLASTSADQQLQIEEFPIAGAVDQTTAPYAAAYVSNAAGSKLDYYLDESLTYRAPQCGVAGTGTITLNLVNDVPRGPLPSYVTLRSDDPHPPVPLGQNRLMVTVLATAASQLTTAELNGAPLDMTPTFVRGHPAWTAFVELPPRHARTITLRVREPAPRDAPGVQHQPLPRAVQVSVAGGC